jgi:hypothetical protein
LPGIRRQSGCCHPPERRTAISPSSGGAAKASRYLTQTVSGQPALPCLPRDSR